MQEKRIFIGSFINSDKLKHNYSKIKNDFSNSATIKWTRTTDNFHITFYFLGNTNMKNIEKLQKFLKTEFSEIVHLNLQIKGLKFFKRRGNPAVLYADVILNEKLQEIFEKIYKFLLDSKIVTKQEKRFKPHITLGRIKKVEKSFIDVIELYKNVNFDTINGIKIELIESVLSSEGALYKSLNHKL